MMVQDEDLIDFADDGPPPSGGDGESAARWTLLIVDDDEEVHAATRFVLRDAQLCGRALRLLHAHSRAEAIECLAREPEVAVILLDVVMESQDSGLQLVREIREDMHRSDVRIVLRTGQPGYAPELKVIRDYDINDYKTKAELTHTRLITTLTAAVRAYDQIRTIAENRRGLELIVSASAGLMEVHALNTFAEGVLTQIAALLHLPGDGIVCAQKGSPFDEGDRVLHVVGAAGRLAPYISHPLEELGDPEITAVIRECIASKSHGFGPRHTVLYLRGSHHEAAVFLRTHALLEAGDRQLVTVFASNLSSCFGNIKLVERLNHLAFHDPLTGAGNRVRFLTDLGDAGAGERGSALVACLLDLDRFTDINSALGHDVGDQLLLAVAARLAEAFPGCALARVHADGFGLIGPASLLTPERIFIALQPPFAAGEQQLAVTATLGRCSIEPGASGNTLFRRAEMALTQARMSPDRRECDFVPAMEERTRRRLDLIRHLRHDFLANRLAVWYQPQVALVGEGIVGVEALLRWPNDGDFVQPPAVFIPLAEDSGLITMIGEWVLDQACGTLRRLQQNGGAALRMAVNVSMPQFRLAGFPAVVARVLASHGISPSALELEITESILMEEPGIVLDNLRALRESGVHISVDDFGTGYSSLGYLRELPIDTLKIDRSFVVEIDSGRGDLFAETIVALARKLGVGTIAEGVESDAQLSRLRELGCDIVQGFLYARPMPVEALEAWIAGRPAGSAPH
ncbi:MAG TPA: EAL domain-containing protein [Aromatoleum sp.]|uniref:EAL domain-containing response regulator n=1 Tax=Aromatoleum sp. TaxID=2307007 RepID=UPI002B4794CF|nr:EAL domain-containing protein [Aromatoleum sp.]HJV26090.1 EAL domain-containing protein [Aromatoleum sp.]